jgi:hypothetical protein
MPINLPKAATGQQAPAESAAITITKDGQVFLTIARHGERRDHEKYQQKKDRVDHRNDLDAGFLGARSLKPH